VDVVLDADVPDDDGLVEFELDVAAALEEPRELLAGVEPTEPLDVVESSPPFGGVPELSFGELEPQATATPQVMATMTRCEAGWARGVRMRGLLGVGTRPRAQWQPAPESVTSSDPTAVRGVAPCRCESTS
jgi:hypothetical protein